MTIRDLEQFRLELADDMPKILLAKTFLTITDGAAKAELKPELLILLGKQLLSPHALLSGPNILIWQNQRRKRGNTSLSS